MFIKRFELFKLLGFPIRIDVSLLLIIVLITWSLAVFTFPFYRENLATQTYWTMGLIGAIGLFVSVLLHELGHAIAARHYDVEMDGITLFIFGGVAEMRDEPPHAVAEFVIAIAGPIVSIALAILFLALWASAHLWEWLPGPAITVIGWLGAINTILVVFNMIPAFPLDGGRVLRAILWQVQGNLRSATRITSRLGSAFGMGLIVLGVFIALMGNLIGGVWFFIIGLFLRGAAQMSYQQLLIRRALEGEPVARFMVRDVVTVQPGMTIAQLVNDIIYRYYHKMYPMLDEDGKLLGCITTRQVKEIPPQQWSDLSVGEVAQPCSDENMISVDTDAMRAMSIMSRTELSRLMVVDDTGGLVGVVALKDLLRFLAMKIELEEDDAGPAGVTRSRVEESTS